MTGADRPFTAAAVPAVERRCRETLAALLSRLGEVAGDGLAGAALGGTLGRGEAPTTVDADGAFVTPVPFELLVVLDATPGRAASLAPRLRRELAATARARSASVRLATAARSALAQLPPTLANLETGAAARVVAGPASLLEPLAHLAAAQPAAAEALALLVRHGAALLLAERALSRRSPSRSALLAGQAAVRAADLALGTVLLVSAGRFRPTDAARDAELRLLAAPAGDGPPPSGFHLRMSRTRFRDLVDRHRAAVEAAREVDLPDSLGEARAQAGRATDRFVEVLRLLEEERLSRPLPSWTDYVRALGERHGGSPGPGLFESRPEGELPSRRSVRAWPVAERLAPALATLLDWDPGDLAVVPLLLDLPDDATKEALGARLAAWAASA
ncbi:MAG: serine/threonine-protein kinase [Thermoanaerobaculia bacterium]